MFNIILKLSNHRLSIKCLLILLLVLTLNLPTYIIAGPSIFINEMHYDNAGSDVNEGVEIAGPAGTDLTGWQIVLYNGYDGQQYDTISLNNSIPDQQNGFGTLWFPISSIQNGAPDGIALVDASNNVMQFLSYEGVFIAVGGPADGLTSNDIGVEEVTVTVGYSLQLQGIGSNYDNFNWASPMSNTTGNKNTGQTFVLNTFTVTANSAGSGSGTVSSDVGGINYNYPATNTKDSSPITESSPITLTAITETGSTVSWTGCDSTGGTTTEATCTISSLDSNTTVTATFTLNQYTLTVNSTGVGSGTVGGSGTYDYGTSHDITATASTGSTFTGWSGDCSGTTSPLSVLVDGNKTCTATFEINFPWPMFLPAITNP